ncbi:transmembrane protein 144 L-like [Pelomyxa schiedti]|nr:transmembrane protein 144 L-like [Pelomyxa schiedti]
MTRSRRGIGFVGPGGCCFMLALTSLVVVVNAQTSSSSKSDSSSYSSYISSVWESFSSPSQSWSSSSSSSGWSDAVQMTVGFIAVTISVLGFGSNFVPVKKFKTGDGVFFQWVMCIGIWCCGLIVNGIRLSKFEPLAMLGGVLWCSGNILAVPIIKLVGLALGLSLWGVTNLLMGWCSGTFGLFGLDKQEVSSPIFNYIGAAICACAVILFAFVQTKPGDKESSDEETSNPLLVNYTPPKTKPMLDKLTNTQKKILGVVLALISGCFYGANFDPPQYLIDNADEGHSSNGIDYVFSHFCGILATSTFYLLVYCIFKKNVPVVFPSAILPGFVSGCIWAVAQIAMFVANSNLSMVITFPICATGPGIVAALWGVIVFREITDKIPLLMLGAAFLVTIIGVTFITLSSVVTV